jgi:threonine dehydrogenase-like Zn-dependent dehydrogenase
MNTVVHHTESGRAVKDIDRPKIEQPTSVVIDITTLVAIHLDKTRCRSVWSTLNVR